MFSGIDRFTEKNCAQLPDAPIEDSPLTHTGRSLQDYFALFEEQTEELSSFLVERSLQQKKIRVLDCGAGKGRALNDLLSGPLRKRIASCTGISLDYSPEVKALLQKHTDRLEWYFHDAVEVLPHIRKSYDLILDVFGAYYYSPERPKLLRSYYTMLKPGGRAFIYLGGGAYQVQNWIAIPGVPEAKKLEQLLFEEHRDSASLAERSLTLHKTGRRAPNLDAEIESVRVKPCLPGLSEKTAVQMRAIFPHRVRYLRREARYPLRALPY